MPLYRTARFDVRPDSVDPALAALRELTENARGTEPGTQLFLSLQDKVHPNRFSQFMIFDDEAAAERYRTAESTKKYYAALQPYIVGGIQFRDSHAIASS